MEDAEGLVKQKEIFDLLLQAKYFRIRIQSLSPFDKILGGMAWCIANSNYEIDLDYNDNLNLGQKIKLAEKVVAGLQMMKCPFLIQPHQIQGLDYKSIYPVVQWLIKFVIETRSTRQDYNRSQAKFLGARLTSKASVIGVASEKSHENWKESLPQAKREAKNSNVAKYPYSNPVRVYSTLIEQGDLTSFSSYQKLLALTEGSLTSGGQPVNASEVLPPSSSSSLAQSTVSTNTQQPSATPAARNSSVKPVQSAKKEPEEAEIFTEDLAIEIIDLNQEGFTRVGNRRKTAAGGQLLKIVKENREMYGKQIEKAEAENVEENSVASAILAEKQIFEEQKQNLLQLVEKRKSQIENLKGEYAEESEKVENHEASLKEYEKVNRQMQAAQEVIKEKLKTKGKPEEVAQITKIYEEKQSLLAQKNHLKKEYKAHQAEVSESRKKIEEEWAWVFNEEEIEKIRKEHAQKKEVYDSRFKVLTEANVKLALNQRKLELMPSTVEIAQYTQRFIEFFESTATEYDKQKEVFTSVQAKQDIKTSYDNHQSLLEDFKKGWQACQKSSQKKAFLANVSNAVVRMQDNVKAAENSLKVALTQKNKNFETFSGLLISEREYYKLLKEVQLHYERLNAEEE